MPRPRRSRSSARHPLRAPVIVVVAARVEPAHPKIPEVEQVAAVAAAAQNMLLAAHALGFAAKWATGKQAYDPGVKAGLGLADDDRILGFLYLGSYAADHEALPPRPGLDGVVGEWPPAGVGLSRAAACSTLLPWLLAGCTTPPPETPAEALARRELSCTEAGFDRGHGRLPPVPDAAADQRAAGRGRAAAAVASSRIPACAARISARAGGSGSEVTEHRPAGGLGQLLQRQRAQQRVADRALSPATRPRSTPGAARRPGWRRRRRSCRAGRRGRRSRPSRHSGRRSASGH